jgi:hypothetical protein
MRRPHDAVEVLALLAFLGWLHAAGWAIVGKHHLPPVALCGGSCPSVRR